MSFFPEDSSQRESITTQLGSGFGSNKQNSALGSRLEADAVMSRDYSQRDNKTFTENKSNCLYMDVFTLSVSGKGSWRVTAPFTAVRVSKMWASKYSHASQQQCLEMIVTICDYLFVDLQSEIK